MSKRRQEELFAVKYRGKLFKAFYIRRQKQCIVMGIPHVKFHRTYSNGYPLHDTFEHSNSDVIDIPSDFPLKVDVDEKKGRIRFLYDCKLPTLDNVDRIVSMGAYAIGVGQACETISEEYHIVDLDAFNCTSPNLQVCITPGDYDLSRIPRTHLGKVEVVKFEGIQIVLQVIDSEQKVSIPQN